MVWLFYIVRVYSIFQAKFSVDIFVFLLQILAEFFIITSEISRPDGIDKTIYRKQFGNFRRCAGFNLSPLINLVHSKDLNPLSTAYGDYCSSRRQKRKLVTRDVEGWKLTCELARTRKLAASCFRDELKKSLTPQTS